MFPVPDVTIAEKDVKYVMSIYRAPEKLACYIEKWLAEHISAAGAKGAVLGISGGIDSAVLAGLLSRAVGGGKVLGVIMPIRSQPIDEEYAMLLPAVFGIKTHKVDLSAVYDATVSNIERNGEKLSELAAANIKPRLRMTALYALAQTNGYLVCGSGNRVELMFGYFTKYGDSGADLLPMADLLKGEVRLLAEYLGVPLPIIDRAPSAGLWEGQTDEGEMGITYNDLDNFFATGFATDEVRVKIESALARSEHKRNMPPIAQILKI